MEKYMTFSVPIKKKCDDSKTITYKLRIIDSFRFMATLLSKLVDNMSGNFNSIECKSCMENNRCEECKKIIEVLIKKFPSIYQFCNGDLNKFILLLRKGIYPYEEMNNCRKFDETTLLLAYVFENFRNMCLELYELDPAYFVSTRRLAWQACLKKTSKIRINNRL